MYVYLYHLVVNYLQWYCFSCLKSQLLDLTAHSTHFLTGNISVANTIKRIKQSVLNVPLFCVLFFIFMICFFKVLYIYVL